MYTWLRSPNHIPKIRKYSHKNFHGAKLKISLQSYNILWLNSCINVQEIFRNNPFIPIPVKWYSRTISQTILLKLLSWNCTLLITQIHEIAIFSKLSKPLLLLWNIYSLPYSPCQPTYTKSHSYPSDISLSKMPSPSPE